MAKKTECYVDTSALIAFLDRSDSFHSVFRLLFRDPPRLVASSLVVAEGHGWFLRRYDRRRAAEFLQFVKAFSPLVILPFDESAILEAETMTKKFADQPLTLADAHGLAILKKRRIETCWSTDRHLSLTGATLVI